MFVPASRTISMTLASLAGVLVLFINALLHGSVWVGIFLSTVAILIGCLGKVGVELRNDRKAYRDCFMLFSWRLGQWQPLLPVVGVTLKYFSYVSKKGKTPGSPFNWGIWNQGSQRHEELVVMLSLEHSRIGLIIKRFELDDVNQAIDMAHDTAEFFDVVVHQFLPPTHFQPLNPE